MQHRTDHGRTPSGATRWSSAIARIAASAAGGAAVLLAGPDLGATGLFRRDRIRLAFAAPDGIDRAPSIRPARTAGRSAPLALVACRARDDDEVRPAPHRRTGGAAA